jgi:hypothetical protein
MCSRFGGGMQAVLGDFVYAARWRLLVEAEEMIQRARPLADGIGFLDCLGDVSFCQRYRLGQRAPASKLRGNCRGKRAPGTVRVFGL